MKRVLGNIGVLLFVGCTGAPAPSMGELNQGVSQDKGYRFALLSTLGDPAPGGGTIINDYEVGSLLDNGDLLFGTDIDSGGEEIVFYRKGRMQQVEKTGDVLPGGFTSVVGFAGSVALNEDGEGVLDVFLDSFPSPLGLHAGMYRYHAPHGDKFPAVAGAGQVEAAVLPGVTPAPGGGTFQGIYFGSKINHKGDIAFPAIVNTNQGVHLPPQPYGGLGIGVFLMDDKGRIGSIAAPGDAAPGGGTFDSSGDSGTTPINEHGEVAFTGHVSGEPCAWTGQPSQSDFLGFCLDNLYLRDEHGTNHLLVHAGDPAPGNNTFRGAKGPALNNHGDVVFQGDLTAPPGAQTVFGVFLIAKAAEKRDSDDPSPAIIPVAIPGDAMPGGGKFVTHSYVNDSQLRINDDGEIAFNAILDNDTIGKGTKDTGLYVWKNGTTRLVARSGTVVPGVGTIESLSMAELSFPPPPIVVPNSGAVINEHGQVTFGATLTDGRGVLFVATPK